MIEFCTCNHRGKKCPRCQRLEIRFRGRQANGIIQDYEISNAAENLAVTSDIPKEDIERLLRNVIDSVDPPKLMNVDWLITSYDCGNLRDTVEDHLL